MAYQGLLRAESELGVVGTVYTSPNPSDYAPNLSECASSGNNLCIGVGFGMGASIAEAALNNPSTMFAIVDVSYQSYPANLRGILFATDEASYLAGTLAALMSEHHVLGTVAGIEIPSVTEYTVSYRRGAECAVPGTSTIITYTGTFVDPELGAQIAGEMIAQGADVIFGVGGQTGNGAILAATQSAVWGIGVDVDQYLTLFNGGTVPGASYLLTSAMKRVDNAVFSTISDVVSHTFTSGPVVYGLAAAGVGLAPFHDADASIPQSVKARLERVKQGIIAGVIDVVGPCPGLVYLPLVVRGSGN